MRRNQNVESETLSPSLIDVLREAFEANRELPPEVISNGIVDYLVEAIPGVIRAMRIPRRPSPFEIARRGFKAQRSRARIKRRLLELTQEQEQFVQELSYLKHQLDGGDSAIAFPSRFVGDETASIPITLGASASSLLGLKLEETTSLGLRLPIPETREPRRIESLSPYVAPPELRAKVYPVVVFSHEIEQLVASNTSATEFFRIVEGVTRKFARAAGVPLEANVSIRKDLELPEWERVVLRMRLEGLDFEERMRLWDGLDREVRGALESSLHGQQPQQRTILEEFNNNFYIEMDLS